MTMHTKEQDRVIRTGESGFTLVEILIAISIFMIGILAIASLQAAALRTNSHSGGISMGVQLAQQKIEELMSMPYDPDNLAANSELDPSQNTTRVNNPETIGNEILVPEEPGLIDKGYQIFWTVCDDQARPECTVQAPFANSLILNVTVQWTEAGRDKQIIYNVIRSEMI